MQDQIFSILTNKESVSWKTLIFEVIKNFNMDPWDVDVSQLSKRYLQMIKKMKDFDFLISGKVLIAAAFLLRLKSVKLVDEDLMEFDRLIAETQRSEQDFLGELYGELEAGGSYIPSEQAATGEFLVPRTPQPRKRKVSVYDLVEALQKALEVNDRKVLREMEAPKVAIPDKRRDISEVMKEIYSRIKTMFGAGKRLTLTTLIPSQNREDVIQTFIPLLHLSHVSHRKIDLEQKEHFGEIEIKLVA